MRIAITGATGFVGGALADHLAAAGHEILTTGRRIRPDMMRHRYERWDSGWTGRLRPAWLPARSSFTLRHASLRGGGPRRSGR